MSPVYKCRQSHTFPNRCFPVLWLLCYCCWLSLDFFSLFLRPQDQPSSLCRFGTSFWVHWIMHPRRWIGYTYIGLLFLLRISKMFVSGSVAGQTTAVWAGPTFSQTVQFGQTHNAQFSTFEPYLWYIIATL